MRVARASMSATGPTVLGDDLQPPSGTTTGSPPPTVTVPAVETHILSRVALVVPSLHPSRDLILPFIEKARAEGFSRIVVVDDGSGPNAEYRDTFEELAERLECTVLRHDVNRGKGRALKTAIDYCATHHDTVEVILTADSDGQHAPHDLARVAERALDRIALRQPATVLGVRTFDGEDIPTKSRLGNKATSSVVRLFFGRQLQDTQTGLRAFPLDVAIESSHVVGEGFDFEMNVLLWLMSTHRAIDEVPIDTIYHDQSNSVSHFRPIIDSTRVYAVILRQFLKFSGASVLSAALDLAVYIALLDLVFGTDRVPADVATSVVLARLVSSLFNFSLNKWLVFHDDSRPVPSLARYSALAVAILAVSTFATTALSVFSGGHDVWAKVTVDGTLFVASYFIQERWVFRDRTLEQS